MGPVGCACPHDSALRLGRGADQHHRGAGVLDPPQIHPAGAIFIWGTPAVYWVVNSDDEAADCAPDELG